MNIADAVLPEQEPEEEAVRYDLGFGWRPMDPDPYLMANGTHAFLLVVTNQPLPDRDQGMPQAGYSASRAVFAVLEFHGFYAVRGFGGPGEATLETHPPAW